MHHSADPERQTLILRCYLDESGTHEGSPQAIVAGLLMQHYEFLLFDVVWNGLLLRHNIQPPLHMKEFGPHGRHHHLKYPERVALFSDISGLINCYKAASVAATLSHSQYKAILHPDIQKQMSMYGLCFMLCVHMVHLKAEYKPYHNNIAYLVEAGNEYSTHITHCYNAMIEMQKQGEPLHVGTLTFADKNISALQAADVIAWAVRRRVSEISIGKGFQPISKIFDENHTEFLWKDSYLQELSDGLLKKHYTNVKS
jgi:hypothetical protein